MNIQAQKLELIEWLASVNDVSIINAILELREKKQADWWDSLSDEQKEDIEAGLEDLEAGRKRPFDQVFNDLRR
jgi:hypothetical protein